MKRLTATLRSAFETGEDLGSGASYVHALAENTERTLIDPNCEVEGLYASLLRNEVKIFLQNSGLETVLDQLEKLIANARSFPVGERP